MNRAVFLDRDGVINRKLPEGQYVTTWGKMHFLPDVARAIALLNRAGFRVIVVSNQRCVAKGLVGAGSLEAIHQRMREELEAAGARIDEIYYCPHEKHPACACRKPAPGMLLAAALAHHIDLTASWMIGDSDVDMQAGKNAGCRTARILSDNESATQPSDILGRSLLEIVDKLLKWAVPASDSSKRLLHGLASQKSEA
jgi:D-glycero-D-manno-heptose 1,7-bisphosphate phosphatase